jgi:hypothetical protein
VRTKGKELVVEGDDLGPVGGAGGAGVGVYGGYRGLDLERSGLAAAKASAHKLVAFGDQGPVPAGAVLVGQADHGPAGVAAGGTAGLGEQHQREETDGLRFVVHQLDEGSPEPDRFGR